MLEIEVCCENCLNEFIIETHLPSITKTICPYCRQWTSLEFKETTHNY